MVPLAAVWKLELGARDPGATCLLLPTGGLPGCWGPMHNPPPCCNSGCTSAHATLHLILLVPAHRAALKAVCRKPPTVSTTPVKQHGACAGDTARRRDTGRSWSRQHTPRQSWTLPAQHPPMAFAANVSEPSHQLCLPRPARVPRFALLAAAAAAADQGAEAAARAGGGDPAKRGHDSESGFRGADAARVGCGGVRVCARVGGERWRARGVSDMGCQMLRKGPLSTLRRYCHMLRPLDYTPTPTRVSTETHTGCVSPCNNFSARRPCPRCPGAHLC